MPYEIMLDDIPAGYAAASVRNTTEVQVTVKGFSSTEDGDDFITYLEGYPELIVNKLPKNVITPSVIDHMLVIIHRDKTADVYVNELLFNLQIRPKRAFEKGDYIFPDDIADVQKLSFANLTIPNDCGYFFYFSYKWRKGLCFDLAPIISNDVFERDYDFEVLFGNYYAYLVFQQLFKITDDEYSILMDQKWFPFISLKSATIKDIMNYVRSGWSLNELTSNILEEVKTDVYVMRERWHGNTILAPHIELLDKALDRFLEADYISTTAILYPRIEGIMRTYHQTIGAITNPSARNLVESTVNGDVMVDRFMLLPEKFKTYLNNVYFAGFDSSNPDVVSRHSVSHGVAPADLFDAKSATIAILIVDQLAFYLNV